MPTGIDEKDWDRVHELACEVANATLIDDQILIESRKELLLSALDELKDKYGEHPSILATIGDFEEGKKKRRKIYSKALEEANEMNLEEEISEIENSIRELTTDYESKKGNNLW